MATPFEFDKYIERSKEDAYRFHQDEKNLSSLRMYLLIFTIVEGFITITTLFDGIIDYDTYACLAGFLAALSLRIFFNKIFAAESIRRKLFLLFAASLIAFLLSGILGTFFVSPPSPEMVKEKVRKEKLAEEKGVSVNVNDDRTNSNSVVVLFSLSLLFFRFPKNDIIQLYALVLGLPVLTDLIFFRNLEVPDKIIMTVTVLVCFTVSYTTERKRHRRFYKQYDVYSKRHSETVRMKRELDYAREMQLSMLPESNVAIDGLNIAATSIPASEVGGDYYDYFKISKGVTGIFICDVSGHGVASALLLSGLRSCMHLILEDTSNPKEVFEKLNRMVRRTQNRKMFVTAVFAVINTIEEKCTLFNAGHLPPYRICGESRELFKIKRHGITLGAIDRLDTDEGENLVSFDFKKGDMLLLYTDGIIEAMNSRRDEYGFERLESFLYANSEKPPAALLEDLIKDVNAFMDGAEQIDDISIMVLTR